MSLSIMKAIMHPCSRTVEPENAGLSLHRVFAGCMLLGCSPRLKQSQPAMPASALESEMI